MSEVKMVTPGWLGLKNQPSYWGVCIWPPCGLQVHWS